MELERLSALAVEAAAAGAEVARSGFGRAKRVETKSSGIDLVTEYDRKAQDAIAAVLRAGTPDYGLLGEEGLSQGAEGGAVWVIDPIDGTTNFAHHSPIFAVSIGLVLDGRPQVGVVEAPEMGERFVAVRGQGATLNGRPMRVSDNPELARAVLATGFAYDRAVIERNLRLFSKFVLRSRAVRRLGSAALDLCWVAAGRFDGFWEMGLKPWDVAAGWLLVEEAGGRVSDLAGGQFSLDGHNLLSSNGKVHGQMLDVLKEEA